MAIKQILTLQLKPQLNGKDLKCVVSHVISAQPLVVRQLISFRAAHSFWSASNQTKKAASAYKMASGKNPRAWIDPGTRNVKEVIIHELFRGRTTDFVFDIGILVLETPFDINRETNLICVDWGITMEKEQLRAGSVGVNQKKLLGTDMICAGLVNQSTSVCGGGSGGGGGLVFLHPGTHKYYIQGMVSISFKNFEDSTNCYSQHYIAFTWFSKYIDNAPDLV